MELLQVNRISKDYINTLPIIRFEGEVVVVDCPEMEDAALEQLKKETCLGFDTESKPAFKKGVSYPVSLVQLSTQEKAYLFQLKKIGFPDGLADIMTDKSIKKIGVGLKADLEKLLELRKFTPYGFVDLAVIAAAKGIIQTGARSLTARYIGKRLVKSAQKTNWAKSVLSMKQQLYAALDAWICLQIYPRILADKTDYDNLYDEESPDIPTPS